ncbi:FMRFamide receptor [Biomphalaria glabrata]|nr:FMRFamide receptor-like [Biomphalaria glabrata]
MNTCISSLIGLLGLVSNVINMVVFFHQGLNSSITISLFCMALTDIFTILFVLWANICFNPYIETVRAPFYFGELFYFTGGWPSGFSVRVTLYITVYITAERCLCILFPLSIKTLITPGRTRVVVGIIIVLNALTLVPEYSSIYLSWQFSPERNETILGAAFRSNRAETHGVTFLLHVLLVIVGQVCVIILTGVLIIHLRRQTEWRMKSVGDKKKETSYSARDRKSQALVIVVATSVVVCYIPLTPVSLITVFMPEFSIGGKYSKVFVDTWDTIFVFSLINAASNIFIYYKMNSKFRTKLLQLVHRHGYLDQGRP